MIHNIFIFSGFPVCLFAVDFSVTLVIFALFTAMNALLVYGAINYSQALRHFSITLGAMLAFISLVGMTVFANNVLRNYSDQCTESVYGLLAALAIVVTAIVLRHAMRRVARAIPYIIATEAIVILLLIIYLIINN